MKYLKWNKRSYNFRTCWCMAGWKLLKLAIFFAFLFFTCCFCVFLLRQKFRACKHVGDFCQLCVFLSRVFLWSPFAKVSRGDSGLPPHPQGYCYTFWTWDLDLCEHMAMAGFGFAPRVAKLIFSRENPTSGRFGWSRCCSSSIIRWCVSWSTLAQGLWLKIRIFWGRSEPFRCQSLWRSDQRFVEFSELEQANSGWEKERLKKKQPRSVGEKWWMILG